MQFSDGGGGKSKDNFYFYVKFNGFVVPDNAF